MADEDTSKKNTKKLIEEVKKLLDELEQGIKNPELKTKIKQFSSVFKDIGKLDQTLNDSPLAFANINDSTITIGGKDGARNVKLTDGETILELIKLLKKALNKRTKKNIKISDKSIEKISNKINIDFGDIINNNYNNIVQEFEIKINQVLGAISNIGTQDNQTIINTFNNIFDNSRNIFYNIQNNIQNNINTVNNAVNQINNNINTYEQHIKQTIKNEISEVNVEINTINENIKQINIDINQKLEDYKKYFEQIISILNEIKPIIIQIGDIIKNFKDLNPEECCEKLQKTLKTLFNLIKSNREILKHIKVLLADKIVPRLEEIDEHLGELLNTVNDMDDRVKQILMLVQENNNLLKDLLTKEEFEKRINKLENNLVERMNRIEEMVRKILENLDRQPDNDDNDDDGIRNKRFELVWIIAKDKKTAQKIKDKEIFPEKQDHIQLNTSHITVNLNERNQHRFAQRIAQEMIQKKFNIDDVYLCLGARIVGTEKPWRWDIKHLKASVPQIYNMIKAIVDQVNAEQNIRSAIETLSKDVRSTHVSNKSLFWANEEDIKDIVEELGKVDSSVRIRLRNNPQANDIIRNWDQHLFWLLLLLKKKNKHDYNKLKSNFNNKELINKLDNIDISAKENLIETEANKKNTVDFLKELKQILESL